MSATLPGLDALVLDRIRADLAPETRTSEWQTPGAMAKALDLSVVQTPALDLIDQALVAVAQGLQRQIVSMPPQEGKSQRISRWFPLWMLKRNPNLRIAIISATFDLAKTFGSRIRDDCLAHPELGLQLSESTHAKHEFQLVGYRGGVYAVGIGGQLVGRPVDLMIIDDPYKDSQQADSKAWKKTVQEFWTEVARPRLAPRAPVVLVQTRWRQDDLAGWLRSEGHGWEVLNIPALADHDPAKGEVDVLGRAPGVFMESARGNTAADWESKRREVGSRGWNAQFQGRPAPVEGEFFKRSWWQTYDQPQWLVRDDGSCVVTGFDELIASWDLTFKDTAGSDYVAGQVWMRRGAEVFLLDQVHGRMNFPDTLRAVRQLSAKWPQALLKLVEDKANGPAVIAALAGTVPGIVPEEPQGGKEARAAAVSPIVEARQAWLPSPELAPWVGGFIDEAAGFPTAAHDDQVDAMSQALNRLILQPLLSGGLVTAEDLDEELAGYSISPY
jgi:predicted phage terminase large subunit-like protein